MIGGVDVIFATRLPSPRGLDAAVRAVMRKWAHAVFQSGSTGQRMSGYSAIPFAQLNEVLIYRNAPAFEAWERLGADPSHDNTMIHLLSYRTGRLTAVVDDDTSDEMRALLKTIRDALEDRSVMMPRFRIAA